MYFVDTHAHLDFPNFDADRKELIADLLTKDIGIINIATDQDSVDKINRLSRDNKLIWGAIGLHPTEIDSMALVELPKLMKQWQTIIEENPKIVAIGEIGLDYHHNRDTNSASLQKSTLRSMITFAIDQKLPIIFHCRDAYGDLATILSDYPDIKGVIHCFSGTKEKADKFIDLGLLLSATAIVTYPANSALAEIFKNLPIDRLMVETDSPFLPSADQRGQRNDPRSVEKVVDFLSKLRGIAKSELAIKTTENAVRMFSLKSV